MSTTKNPQDKYSKLLMPGEEMSFVLRPHWRFIIAGLGIGTVVIVAWWLWADVWQKWLGVNSAIPKYIGAFVAIVILLRYTIRPIVQWLFTKYYFTTYRVMTRKGVVTRKAADIPLDKISNVYYEQQFWDRMLRCGSLIIDSSGGDGFTIDDVPNVERVTRDMHVLIEGGLPAGRLNGPDGVAPARKDRGDTEENKQIISNNQQQTYNQSPVSQENISTTQPQKTVPYTPPENN